MATRTDVDLQRRLEQLSQRIGLVRAEITQGLEPEPIAHVLAVGDILHRHGELSLKARRAKAEAEQRARQVMAELAADLKGIEDALRGWMVRLDERHRR
jgi:hypothetical protein